MPFTCAPCNYSTNSASEYRAHLQSSEHIRKTEAKQKQASNPSIESVQTPPSATKPITSPPSSLNQPSNNNNTISNHQYIRHQPEPVNYSNTQKHPTSLDTHDQIYKQFPNNNPLWTHNNAQIGYPNIPTNTNSNANANINSRPFYPPNYQQHETSKQPMHNDNNNRNITGGSIHSNVKIQEPYYPHHAHHHTQQTSYQYYPNDSRSSYSNYSHSTNSTNSTNSNPSPISSQEQDLVNTFNNLNLNNSISQHLNNWYCSLCEIGCNSKEKYDEHIRGSKHQKKQKALYQGSAFSIYNTSSSQDPIQSISPDEMHRGISPPISNNYQTTQNTQPPPKAQTPIPEMFRIHSKYYSKTVVGSLEIFSCTLCNVDCNGPDVLLTHFNGKQHLKNVNREQINAQYISPPPTSTSSHSTYTSPPPSHPPSSNQSFYSNEYSRNTSPNYVDNTSEQQPSIGQLIQEGVVTIQKIGKQDGYICTACEMFCNSVDALQDHIKGRKHIKSYASFLAKNLIQQPQTAKFVPINPISSDEPEFDESRSVQILEYFWSQTFGQNSKPAYIETCYGPSHSTSFRCEIDLSSVKLDNQIGDGKTKKEAKKNACTKSCTALDRIGALKKAVPPYLYYSPSKK